MTEAAQSADLERLYIETHDNARDWTRQPPMSWGDVADLLSEVRALRAEVFEQSCWIQTLSEESLCDHPYYCEKPIAQSDGEA